MVDAGTGEFTSPLPFGTPASATIARKGRGVAGGVSIAFRLTGLCNIPANHLLRQGAGVSNAFRLPVHFALGVIFKVNPTNHVSPMPFGFRCISHYPDFISLILNAQASVQARGPFPQPIQ